MKTDRQKRRRGRGPRALAASVAELTRPIFGRRGFADGAVVGDWAAIVGPILAAHSAPERIAFGPGRRDDGTLHLRIDSGGLATELQHLEPQLIERINAYFGYRAVGRLRIVQGPPPVSEKPPPPPTRPLEPDQERELAERLSGVDDDDLRRALGELGRAVIGRRSR